MSRGIILLLVLAFGLLISGACQSVTVIEPVATDSAATEQAGATRAELLAAWATVALALIALVGFFATFGTIIITNIRTRNRQQIEFEGYVRVDIGPPQGTDDFPAPPNIAHIEGSYLTTFGDANEQAAAISVWYRNLQDHSLGIAFGIVGEISGKLTDSEGEVYEFSQTHFISYLEPGKCVRIDVVLFPREWQGESEVTALSYRNLHWDGSPPTHGRTTCYYEDGEFYMVPWSDPESSLRDWFRRQSERLITPSSSDLDNTRA